MYGSKTFLNTNNVKNDGKKPLQVFMEETNKKLEVLNTRMQNLEKKLSNQNVEKEGKIVTRTEGESKTDLDENKRLTDLENDLNQKTKDLEEQIEDLNEENNHFKLKFKKIEKNKANGSEVADLEEMINVKEENILKKLNDEIARLEENNNFTGDLIQKIEDLNIEKNRLKSRCKKLEDNKANSLEVLDLEEMIYEKEEKILKKLNDEIARLDENNNFTGDLKEWLEVREEDINGLWTEITRLWRDKEPTIEAETKIKELEKAIYEIEDKIYTQEDEFEEFKEDAEKILRRHENTIKFFKNMELDKKIFKVQRHSEDTLEEVLKMKNFQKLKEMEVKPEEKLIVNEILGKLKNAPEVRLQDYATKTEIRELEQESKKTYAEIYNVPETEKENLKTVVKNIAKKKGVHVDDRDIEEVYRFSSRGSAIHKPIRVIFTTKSKRDEFIQRKKGQKPIKQNEIIQEGNEDENILIYEYITQYFKDLLYKAKEFAKENNVKFAWYRNCTILLRKTEEDEKIYTVRDEDDLRRLKERISTKEDDNPREEE